MKKSLSLKQASRIVRRSDRQVRRLIIAGRIKATGGGHGVPFRIDEESLRRFRPEYRRRWRPFACEIPKWQIFARYAATLMRADDALSKTAIYASALARTDDKKIVRAYYEELFACVSETCRRNDIRTVATRALWRDGDVDKWVDNLVPLSRVRIDLVEAAQKLDNHLDLVGWDFLLAAKVVRHAPTQKNIMAAMRLKEKLSGDLYLENTEIMKLHRRAEFGGCGHLCDNAVGAVLGVHRHQAARIRQRVFARLGDDVIFAVIGLQLPVGLDTLSPSWLRSIRMADPTLFDDILPTVADSNLKCPHCKESVPETSDVCPECGHLL